MKFITKSMNVIRLIVVVIFLIAQTNIVLSEDLQSESYTIQDISVNSTGDILVSENYDMLTSLGDINSDSRLISGSYELQSGYPSNLNMSIPLINCFETTTDNSTSLCSHLPRREGARGECGSPGCYDKAKIEIGPQDNPYDTLYLIRLVEQTDNTIYYLKSDHTLGLDFDASNFMTRCELEGKDDNNPDCDDPDSSGWNASLQSMNIYNLQPNTEYQASALALNGDLTDTGFSESIEAETTSPALIFDINIADDAGANTQTAAPYDVSMGDISFKFPVVANDLIWLNLGTNLGEGIGIYIKGSTNGLYSSSKDALIPSESEDLALDSNQNGGFGIKTYNYSPSQLSLGPLLKSSTYDTAGVNEVGQVTTSNSLLFYTSKTESTFGAINNGKGALQLQARAAYNTPISGDYEIYLTTIIVGNY